MMKAGIPNMDFVRAGIVQKARNQVRRRRVPWSLTTPYRTLPDGCDTPSRGDEFSMMAAVTKLVATELFQPELPPCAWKYEQWAVMAVPETSVDKDQGAAGRKNEVGTARKFSDIESVAKSHSMERPPQCKFRLRIASAHRGHVPRSLLGRMDVGQIIAFS